MKYAAAAVVLGCLSAGCTVTVDSHSEILREEKRFPVQGVADVRLTTFDGSIQVQAWDKPEVLVEIEKRGPDKGSVEDLVVTATQQGAVIEVEVKRPRRESLDGLFQRTAYARLIVSVPRETNVRARSGDGSIRLDGVKGRLELRTSDGSVRVADAAGELVIDTSDGSVAVSDVDAAVTVDTSDGSISVDGKLALARLNTGDGSITCRAAPGSSIGAEGWNITTGDGTVTLYLPPDLNASLDAHTGDGRITTDLEIERGDSDERIRRTLKGTLGTGGQTIRVRTGDGSIRLKRH